MFLLPPRSDEQGKLKKKRKITTTAGLEPARAKPKRFLIFRLNHSAKLPLYTLLVVLRARVIPECLDNPNINSLREVTSCQNGLSD